MIEYRDMIFLDDTSLQKYIRYLHHIAIVYALSATRDRGFSKRYDARSDNDFQRDMYHHHSSQSLDYAATADKFSTAASALEMLDKQTIFPGLP